MPRNLSYTGTIPIILILYIYLYNPVFRFPGKGLVSIITLFGIAIFFLKPKLHYYSRYYRKETILTIFMALYLSYTTFFVGKGAEGEVTSLLLWAMDSFFTPLFIVEVLLNKKGNNVLLFPILIKVGMVAAVLSLLSFCIPPFKTFLLLIQSDKEAIECGDDIAYRMFGLSTNLFSSYGVIQGTLAGLCVYFVDKKNIRYAVYSLILVSAAAINARTGIIPFILLSTYRFYKELKKGNVKLLFLFVFFILIIVGIIVYAYKSQNETIVYTMLFFTSFYELIFNGNTEGGAFFDALEYMLRLPETAQGLIFGEGISLFHEERDALGRRYNSDIGYVNQMFLGGIIFTSSLVLYTYLVTKQMLRGYIPYVIPWFLFIVTLLINFKGMVIYNSSPYSRLVMLLYFAVAFNLRKGYSYYILNRL